MYPEHQGRRKKVVYPEHQGRRNKIVYPEHQGRRNKIVYPEHQGKRNKIVCPEQQGRRNKIVSGVVFVIKICSCEFLGFHSHAVGFSVLVSCGTSVGDWSPTFRDKYIASKSRCTIHPVTLRHISERRTKIQSSFRSSSGADTRTHAHTHTRAGARPVVKSSILDQFNHLKTKLRLLYLTTQSVPRCKHFSSRL